MTTVHKTEETIITERTLVSIEARKLVAYMVGIVAVCATIITTYKDFVNRLDAMQANNKALQKEFTSKQEQEKEKNEIEFRIIYNRLDHLEQTYNRK